MKTNVLSLFALLSILFFAACASEDAAKQDFIQEPDTDGLTAFVVEDNSTKTRTTADYDGSGINFYWTAGDRLWVNDAMLKQDVRNTINNNLENHPTMPTTAVKRVATAKFYFNGTFTGASYPVRYTGKNSTAGDKVTIKAQQNQNVPNDASHLGESGDCGTATAIQSGGRYNFTLDHKAAYLTFIPYSTQEVVREGVITEIQVTVNSYALVGQFNFDDTGIVLSSRPAANSTNRTISLKLNNFPIPPGMDATKNAAIMVLPPGSYNRVTVTYIIHSPITNMSGKIYKDYTGITLTAGKNKKVSTDLQVTDYSSQSIQSFSATNGCPNVNECWWYFATNRTYWDNLLWAYKGHLYANGMWFRKKQYISGFNAANFKGVNRLNAGPEYEKKPTASARPTPVDRDKVFFMPALGNGTSGMGAVGRYWTSNDRGSGMAYVWAFSETSVGVGNNYKVLAMPLWTTQ